MTYNPLDFFRKNRSDLSNFLIHLTKNGSFEEWVQLASDQGGLFRYGNSPTLVAKDSLREILAANPPTLLARAPFGIFKLKGINTSRANRKLDVSADWLKCVCFSETPLRELKSFYGATQDVVVKKLKANNYQKYGLAFATDLIRSKNGNPVFYYDRKCNATCIAVEALGTTTFQSITRPILHLFEPYGPKVLGPNKEVDFRWEREWRILGNFQFSFSEVAFGLCPESEIEDFEKLVSGIFPFVDPDWELPKLKDSLTSKGHQRLADKI